MGPNNGLRQGNNASPVGVVAATCGIAESIARELGMRGNVVKINASGLQARGIALSALLVDESAWPMSEELIASVLPALERSAGYVLHLERVDPKKGLKS